MLHHGFHVEAVGVVDAAFPLSDAGYQGAFFLQKVRRVVAHVAQPLHDDALAAEAAAEAGFLQHLAVVEQLAQPKKHAQPSGFGPAPDAALAHGLARDAAQRAGVAVLKSEVSIGYPGHFAAAGAVIGRGHVGAGPDEVFLNQLAGVASRHAFQGFDGAGAGVDFYAAFGPAERHVDQRTLKGHERGQGLHLVLVHVNAVANAAFAGQLVVAVLHPDTLEYLNFPLNLHRKINLVDAVADLNLGQNAGVQLGETSGLVVELQHAVVEILSLYWLAHADEIRWRCPLANGEPLGTVVSLTTKRMGSRAGRVLPRFDPPTRYLIWPWAWGRATSSSARSGVVLGRL